jgi:nicotinic acid mononucleotide adenylyltransferase
MASFAAAADTSVAEKDIKHVAWMGGSLSPPTNAHFNVALEIGRKLRETKEKSRVCIVPVSPAYNKPSINEKCVPNQARLELAKSLVDALNAENTDPDLDFVLELHEYESLTAVTTFDSLEILKTKYDGATIYISQGQDNIEAIFKRKWANSDKLLEYSFIVYPRGTGVTDIKGELVKALQSSKEESKDKAFEPYTTPEQYEPIINRTQVINTEFNDDTSSSKLRIKIRSGENVEDTFHPTVYAKYLELLERYPNMYKTTDCEPQPKAGGNRKTKRRRTNKKRRSQRKKRRSHRK